MNFGGVEESLTEKKGFEARLRETVRKNFVRLVEYFGTRKWPPGSPHKDPSHIERYVSSREAG